MIKQTLSLLNEITTLQTSQKTEDSCCYEANLRRHHCGLMLVSSVPFRLPELNLTTHQVRMCEGGEVSARAEDTTESYSSWPWRSREKGSIESHLASSFHMALLRPFTEPRNPTVFPEEKISIRPLWLF